MNQPDPLDDLISAWREPTAAQPDLRRRVWQRIDAAESHPSAARPAFWLETLGALFRQRTAVAWVVVCVVLGVVSAEIRATRVQPAEIARVATTYLQIINPLLRTTSGGPP
jgi:hypothetical protein